MWNLFELAQGATILTFLVPAIIGVFVGALIMLVAERIKKNNQDDYEKITMSLEFENGTNFTIRCGQMYGTIFCPICSFKNRKPYKMSKHLKGHFKKGEGKELFISQQKTKWI